MNRREDYGNKADPFFDSLSAIMAPLAPELRGIIRKALPKASSPSSGVCLCMRPTD